MKKVQYITLAVVAVLGLATTSGGAIFSNFESPTYTAGSTYIGVDGWSLFSGIPARAKVTPATDDDVPVLVPNVLEGAQSAFLKGTQAYRKWNGLEVLVSDGLEISWLMEATALTRTELYLSDNPAVGNTPVGFVLDASGNIKIQAPDSGLVDSGIDYLAAKTYLMTMKLDFALNTMTATSKNITDSGPVVGLGSVFYGNAFETALVAAGANGGLYLVERDGNRVIFDNLQVFNENFVPVVPEPGAAVLLAVGGLVAWRRRGRK